MTSQLNFILGMAMFVVATTVAVTISKRQPAAEEERPPDEATFVFRKRPASMESRPSAAADPSGRASIMAEILTVQVDPLHPERDRLEALASQVEHHAKERLAQLTRDLDLSVDQQRRIFPKLVATSESYHPAMVVGSRPGAVSPTASPGADLAIETELDPLQRDLFIEESLSDLMLWREIIAQLENRLDQQVPDLQPHDPVMEPTPDPVSGGGRNLFDLVPAGD